MPYEWTQTVESPPQATLRLWPYQSLPPEGFVWFIGATAAMIALPLISVLGTAILWGLLPFLVGAVWAIWAALRHNARSASLNEVLTLTRDTLSLVRHNPRGPEQRWEANPYWVEVRLHPQGGPVEDYLTLRGSDREVELGRFLSPDERKALYGDLRERLSQLK